MVQEILKYVREITHLHKQISHMSLNEYVLFFLLPGLVWSALAFNEDTVKRKIAIHMNSIELKV